MHDASSAKTTREYIPTPPATLIRTATFCLAVLFVSLKVTGWLEATSEKTYRAVLNAHSTLVTADRNARIVKPLIAEGAPAEIGTSIITLADEELAVKLKSQQQTVESLKLAFSKAKAQAEMDLAWRMKQLNAEILETRLRSADLLKDRFDQDVEKMAMSDVMHESKIALRSIDPESLFMPVDHQIVTPGRLELEARLRKSAAMNASQVATVQIDLCEDRLKELYDLKQQLPEKIRQSAGVEVAEHHYETAVNELEQLKTQKQEFSLSSSAYGTVGVFTKSVDETISAGETIVEILDHERCFLIVQIPSEDLAAVTEGDEITLMFSGSEKRTGIIPSIPPQTAKTSAGGHDEAVSIRIDQVGKLWPNVPIGSVVEVTLRK